MDNSLIPSVFWWKLTIGNLTPTDQELLVEFLVTRDCLGLEEISDTSLIAYFPHNPSEEQITVNLIQPIQSRYPKLNLTLNRLYKENWLENWKENFHPIPFPDKYIIRAPWHPNHYPEPSIVIEPNFAFGTGHHESTRIILHLLDQSWVQNRRVLDIGCGSGILCFASALLNAHDVTGIDNDPEAIIYAEKNLQEYNPGLPIRFLTTEPDQLDWNFDCVLMNIITSGQYPILKKISNLPWDYLMTSGILIHEKKDYLDYMKEIHLNVLQEWTENEWIGFILTRN